MRRKIKSALKKCGLLALITISLLAWGLITGLWGYVALTAYLMGAFTAWVRRRASTPTLITLTALAMIPTLDTKIDALQKWRESQEENIIEAARAFEAEILDYNTEEQLFRLGQDSDGRAITPPYAELTKLIKRASGQPVDRVTLRDTGDFHRSFLVVWQPRQFYISAADPKTGGLIRKYGAEVFGLNDAGLQNLIDDIRPEVTDSLRKTLEA